ncbi:hypothetical protein E2C01_041492 [Portunus trituberculatus]|uniref:Uncharacterized protein n=1 Tax=Portunus trituberculatus TaxID=210409 RepID=A0A5B7FQJ4_PORTR|nr:hypothetical protein [Portunus trituberculatus]
MTLYRTLTRDEVTGTETRLTISIFLVIISDNIFPNMVVIIPIAAVAPYLFLVLRAIPGMVSNSFSGKYVPGGLEDIAIKA